MSAVPLTPSAPNDVTPARFRDRVRSRTGTGDLFLFRVGDERFAFDLRAVDEVIESPVLHAIPMAPVAVAGVCRHGEASLTVVRAGFVLGVDAPNAATVVVMRRGDGRLGLLVDDVDEVAAVELSELRQPPFDEEDDYLIAVHWNRGVLTSVLDARAVVSAAELQLTHGPR